MCRVISIYSLSSKTEHVDDDIVVLERILLAEIAIIFAIPKATGRHVEPTITLLQDNHVRSEFQVLVNLLQKFDDDFTGIVAPLLGLLRIVVARLELPKD